MPELDFKVTRVMAAARGLTPLLQFALEVTSTPASEHVEAALIEAQIQILAPQRVYSAREQAKRVELFGEPGEDGDVPLRFLFSGSVFDTGEDGRLQVTRISWNKECDFSMPGTTWRELMEHHYPKSAWLYVARDVFERLAAYKRAQGLPSWDAAIERLLPPEGLAA